MKLIIIVLLSTLCISATANAQTFKFLTTIESVIPAGMGRSRMIINEGNNEMTEIELKNFFSIVGIQFANIKDNDTLIAE